MKLLDTTEKETCMLYERYPRLTRTHTVLTGRKYAHTSSKTLPIHKVFPAAFSSSGRLSASAKLLAPDSDGFSCDFWLLRRRCVVTHQDEKGKPFSRTPSKAQRSGFVRKKEEGESIMEFSPQGGNGMTRTSSDASGVCALVNRGYARQNRRSFQRNGVSFVSTRGNCYARCSIFQWFHRRLQ